MDLIPGFGLAVGWLDIAISYCLVVSDTLSGEEDFGCAELGAAMNSAVENPKDSPKQPSSRGCQRYASPSLEQEKRMTDPTADHRPTVLFLCVHNAGRSQMAAGWLRNFGADRIDVFSAGSNPGTSINQAAVAAMDEVGIDISAETPKRWTDAMAQTADVVVTMGCGDTCPIYPGTRYEDWELTDPAGQPLSIVRKVRDEIRGRVVTLMTSLGVSPGS